MTKVTIQVPVNKSLKISAEKAALESGFSSLQEAIRVFMTQFAKKAVSIGIFQSFQDEILTSQQDAIIKKKYEKIKKEIADGKGFVAHTASEMMEQLRS